MDMVSDFFTFPTIVFILTIYALSVVVREFFEAIFPVLTEKNSKSRWKKVWREFFLVTIPIVLGGTVGYFITFYPYPEFFAESWQSRTPYGIVCGLISLPFFRLFMTNLHRVRVSIMSGLATIKDSIVERIKSK